MQKPFWKTFQTLIHKLLYAVVSHTEEDKQAIIDLFSEVYFAFKLRSGSQKSWSCILPLQVAPIFNPTSLFKEQDCMQWILDFEIQLRIEKAGKAFRKISVLK